ncbi:MAG: GNAT family N-acetyltransferase [Desulfuromonadaceae bacterium]
MLRPLCADDAPALTAAAAESREHYGFTTVPDGSNEVQLYLDKAFRQQRKGTRLAFTIMWHDRVVGTTSFFDLQFWEWPAGTPRQRDDAPDAVEIGYTWLAASAQRTIVNSEAKSLLLQHAFETWQVHRLCLRTDVRNLRSWRAIERLGARFEGVRRADMPGRDGSVRDSAIFAIVAAEWPEVKAHLGTLVHVDVARECLKHLFPF